MRKVIVNLTPLITLSKLRHVFVLRELYEEIIIPVAVKNEVTVKNDLASQEILDNLSWINVMDGAEFNREIFSSKLHAGEIEMLVLAHQLNADLLVVDDKPARKVANAMGFNITGTLGVLVKAKSKGIIKAVSPFVESMHEINIYLSDSAVEMALRQAGEN